MGLAGPPSAFHRPTLSSARASARVHAMKKTAKKNAPKKVKTLTVKTGVRAGAPAKRAPAS